VATGGGTSQLAAIPKFSNLRSRLFKDEKAQVKKFSRFDSKEL